MKKKFLIKYFKKRVKETYNFLKIESWHRHRAKHRYPQKCNFIGKGRSFYAVVSFYAHGLKEERKTQELFKFLSAKFIINKVRLFVKWKKFQGWDIYRESTIVINRLFTLTPLFEYPHPFIWSVCFLIFLLIFQTNPHLLSTNQKKIKSNYKIVC